MSLRPKSQRKSKSSEVVKPNPERHSVSYWFDRRADFKGVQEAVRYLSELRGEDIRAEKLSFGTVIIYWGDRHKQHFTKPSRAYGALTSHIFDEQRRKRVKG